jgi:methylmalonyl-CoA mutase cobalamin-binding subunit
MPRRAPTPPPAAVHPIQVVTRRTGLSADVIRTWEKRYGVVAPLRTPTGRRLYADADIERLRLLGRATLAGYSIRRAAALPPATLATVARDDASRDDAGSADAPAGAAGAAGAADVSQPADAEAAAHLDACLTAIERFDAMALDVMLRRATVALSAANFLDALVRPLDTRVTVRLLDGTLRAPHRHLARAVLRRVLDQVMATAASPAASPDLVVTTPTGQSQEIGALVTAAAAAAEGWRVTYVGPGLPAEEVAEAAALLEARAVALSLGSAAGDRLIPRELRRLRALLAADVAILVEGSAADAHRAVLGEIGATVLRDTPALRARLRALT